MHFSKVTFLATAAAALQPRDLAQNADKCSDAIMPAIDALEQFPVTALDVMKLYDPKDDADPCEIPAATGTNAAAYSSWATSVSKWHDGHKSEINGVVAACTDIIHEALDKVGDKITLDLEDIEDLALFHVTCDSLTFAKATSTPNSRPATATGTVTSARPTITGTGSSRPSNGTATGTARPTSSTPVKVSGASQKGAAGLAVIAVAGLVAAAI